MRIFTEGFVLQASLILALGAQNLFIIEVALKRNHHLLAATICSICDMLLIILGVLGVSALLVKTAVFKVAIGMLGAVFLSYYALQKLIEAFKGVEMIDKQQSVLLPRRMVVLATLSFTLLNPHVYIDTFFLVGGYSTRFEAFAEKLIFGLGAGTFSTVWFFFLASFSSRFSDFLSKEINIRVTSFITGAILAYLAYGLGADSLANINLV
ncbi:MAG: hypothetical protein CMJ16_07725 [Peredibacter sp.]|nr:hypothetical protein [Peredibacter sp.]